MKEVIPMLEFLKNEANMTMTENGAATYASSGSECLDLFATVGALRHADEEEIETRFLRAYSENPDLAMKILFFARDIRGGLGERRVFRTVLKWLSEHHEDSALRNIGYVPEYGRYDDLLCLVGTKCEDETVSVLKKQFEADCDALSSEDGEVSLLGKWLPSINTSNAETVKLGRRMARAFGLSEAEYRKVLSALRARIKIIENNLREKDYTFDYSKQPSRAMFKYRKAFGRNDKERYEAFLKKVSTGEAKLHAENVCPYELVNPYLGYYGVRIPSEEQDALNATWTALPDFGGDEDMLAIIDNSGSMYGQSNPKPAAVALSLGMYFAERNKGAFRGHFITFSEHPLLIKLKGDTFAERLEYAASFSEVANTNLEAVFDLILSAAVRNSVPQRELPTKLVIISDMEFDSCVEHASLSNFENAKKKFSDAGYRLPDVIFWNVDSRNRQQPVKMNEQGVALVSGATPRLFSMVAGGIVSPYAFMMDVLNGERYKVISA